MRNETALGAVLVLLGACAPLPAPTADRGLSVVTLDGISATVLLGTFDRGYGAAGLSLLALLADEEGSTWSGEVLDDSDDVLTAFTYGTADGTQAVPAWWPTVPAAYGARYTLRFFETGGREVRVKATLSATSGLEVPALELTADGLRLEWPAVSRAAAYDCSPQPGVVSEHVVAPGCTIPAGQTAVTVRALNVDLSAPLVTATLPSSFDLSEATHVYGVGASGVRGRAALGAIQYTTGGAGFAALVSIQTAAGAAPATAWDIEISGPAFGSAGSKDNRSTDPGKWE